MKSGGPPAGTRNDPADAVGVVLAAKRDVLLRVHRHRLQPEDLEDCLAQAALELIGRARNGDLLSERHVSNALEQKFLSRVIDRQRVIERQRAIAGRSALAAATGVQLDADETHGVGLAYGGTDISQAAADRDELRRIREVAADLSDDQRLVLACQVSLGMESAEFCERYGWTAEKFKKVAQRARARLTKLMAEYELGERCRRLEGDLIAYAANVASAAQVATVRPHLANCTGCAAYVRDLRLASGRVAAVLPIGVLALQTGALKAGVAAKLHRLWRALGAPVGRAGGRSTAGSAGVGGLAKAGAATLCAAGLAVGGHAVVAVPKLHRPASPAARASLAQRAPTPPAATTVSDVLRPARPVKTTKPARPRPAKRPAGRRGARRHSGARAVSRSPVVGAGPATAAATAAPSLPPPARTPSAPAPTPHVRRSAPPAAPDREFGVE